MIESFEEYKGKLKRKDIEIKVSEFRVDKMSFNYFLQILAKIKYQHQDKRLYVKLKHIACEGWDGSDIIEDRIIICYNTLEDEKAFELRAKNLYQFYLRNVEKEKAFYEKLKKKFEPDND